MIELIIAVVGTLLLITAGTASPRLAPQPVRTKRNRR
jgi:hypothetical protein